MKRNDRSALCDAVIDNDESRFYELLSQGVDVNERDYNKVTALWYAAQFGRTKMVKTLLDNGARVDIVDDYGNSPLSKAVYWYDSAGDSKLIELLISHGADVSLKNNYGVSPLDLAKTIAGFPYLDLLE